MEQPLVSIVVPVYNASSHIAQCLESIRKQTYQNIEIILVNDGSEDVSLSVCQMYARVDKRMLLLNKTNSGVSATRNLAIDRAKGKYLQFVDSDDYLDPNATQLLVEKAEANQTDMVIAHYFRVEQVKVIEPPCEGHPNKEAEPTTKQVIQSYGFLDEGFYSKTDFAKKMIQEPASFYYGVMWNKLYRRDIIEIHNIRCSEELGWSEDLLFNLEYIRHAARFYSLQTPIYYYVQNPQSITASKIKLRTAISTKANIFSYYKELYEDMGLYDQSKLQILKYFVSGAET